MHTLLMSRWRLRLPVLPIILLIPFLTIEAQESLPPQAEELEQLIHRARKSARGQRSQVSLTSEAFQLEERAVLSPALSRRRPAIRTFSLLDRHSRQPRGFVVLNDRDGIIRLESGADTWLFRAPVGRALIPEPVRATGSEPGCAFEPSERALDLPQGRSSPVEGAALNQLFSYGTQLRKYRLAVVATFEYFSFFPDYQTAELELIASVVDLSQSYRQEFAIDFELSDYHIHTQEEDGIDPAADRLIGAQQAVTAQFSVDAFDVGHVFHQEATGGVANGGVVCIADWKARGWTANVDASVANIFWRQTLLHEFGHQFGASHTMDGTAGQCGVGRFGPAAYEPMSGSTIMSYYGGCLNQNVSFPEAKGFHVHSRQEVFNFSHFGAGNACATVTETENQPPVVDAQAYGLALSQLPVNTPFILSGSGYDPDGEDVLFSWEQYDRTELLVDPSDSLPNADDPDAPLFRTYFPTELPVRVFPRMETVLSNSGPNIDEALPTVGRTMNFRLTARDQNPNGGGVSVAGLSVTVDGNSGPFLVSSPNGGEVLPAGVSTNISWDPAGTEAYLAVVDIRLSTDGGLSFPYTLAEDEPNDGQHSVVIPDHIPLTDQARLMVVSGITSSLQFFDVSDADFTITTSCALAPLGNLGGPQYTAFGNQTGLIDPELSYLGFPADRFTFDIADDGSAPRAPMTGFDLDRENCETRAEEDYQDIFLQVDRAGSYLFQIPDGDQCHGYITLFDEAQFDENDPCASFLASNSFGGFWYCDFTAELEPGKQYRLRAYDVLGDLGEVQFIPRTGGHVYFVDPAQAPDLDWVAVDQESQEIVAFSDSGNFPQLPTGRYHVYGIRTTATSPASDFPGKSKSELQTEGFCIEWTNNYKTLEIQDVLGTCQVDELHIDDANTLTVDTIRAGQMITTDASFPPGRDFLLQAGEKIVLEPGFSAAGNFAARIDLCAPPVTEPFEVSTVLRFDGVDDEVGSLPSTDLYCSDFTIETWVRMDELAVGDAGFFLEIGDVGPDKWLWFTGVDSDGFGSVICGYRNGGTFQDFSFAFVPRVGEWMHLAATYSDATREMSFYINGYLQGTQTGAISPGNEGTPRIRLGRQISGGVSSHHFSGALEEVRFWSECRTAQQVRQHMRRELTGAEAALLAYYAFNAPPTPCIDVWDCSINALHGTRKGLAGPNNLPQYESELGPLQELTPDCNEVTPPCHEALLPRGPFEASVSGALDLRLSPNPASSFFRLDYALTADQSLQIALYDLSGNLIRDLLEADRAAGLHRETFSGIDLPPGVYLIRLQTPDSHGVQRLVWAGR